MLLDDLKTKQIGVLGLGVNNLALTEWLLKHGAQAVTICDVNLAVRRDHPEWEGKVRWRLGPNYLDHLTDFEIVFRTPGIPYLSPPIQAAKAAGVEISSQTKLFFSLTPAKIIGVTGTKGKGTTATLIYEILKNQRHRNPQFGKVYLAGNIGTDPFTFLDELKPNDWVILELSSFQLQDLDRSPHIAVVLDVTSDHLDYHTTTDEYVAAKTPIVRYQTKDDFAVLNLDSETSLSFGELTIAQIWYYSRRKSVDQGTFVSWTPVGSGARFGKIILRTAEQEEIELARTYDLKLRGEHNLENIAAAATAAYLVGAEPAILQQTITSFRGLEHRLEYVGDVAGRAFYNDSFATTPEPTIAAIRSFTEPIHLIVGGSSKGTDFTELGSVIACESSVATVIPLGEVEGPRIVAAIEKARIGARPTILPPTHSMQEAVSLAFETSQPGDIILLSPAAASFDLFPNYKERGKQFRAAVKSLARRI